MRWQRIVFSVTVTEGLLTEVSEKRKGCGRKAIPPVVARILSGDSTSPLTRDGHGCLKLNAQSFKHGWLKVSHAKPLHDATALMADEAM